MGRHGIIIGSIIAVIAILWVHSGTLHLLEYEGRHQWDAERNHLTEQARIERARAVIAQEKYETFKNYVAAQLPETLKNLKSDDEASYPARNLASVLIRSEPLRLTAAPADTLLADGKRLFREKSYSEALDRFSEIIEKHPESPLIPEAYFLKAESYYQLKNFDLCVATANTMLDQFPESDLTGFMLLRLGQIFEFQERSEDAEQVYRTIAGSFSNKELLMQARSKLAGSGE